MKCTEAICVLQNRIQYPEDDTYGGMCERDYQQEAVEAAVIALSDKQERENGCEWCCDEIMFDGEDMELELQHPLEDKARMVYPRYCPMCGRSLEIKPDTLQ